MGWLQADPVTPERSQASSMWKICPSISPLFSTEIYTPATQNLAKIVVEFA
jgi:hypothetical protein